MPENMPKPSMLPVPNRFHYAPSFIGTYQHLFVWRLGCRPKKVANQPKDKAASVTTKGLVGKTATTSNERQEVRTRAVGALARARCNSLRARSYSLFSDSSLTAANQMSSLLGFALNANARILRAFTTSP